MSAAFALQPSGPPAPCSFPRCTRDAFHDGEHNIGPAAESQKNDKRLAFPGPHYFRCAICGVKVVEYGDPAHPPSRICDELECALELSRREAAPARLLCPCRQRPYAHELSIHKLLRSESYHPQRRFSYPWSLCMSERLELSAEKE